MPSVLLVDGYLKWYPNWGLVLEDKDFLQQGTHELYDENKLADGFKFV